MAQFASNNPLTRKLQQEAAKRVTKLVGDQVAKNGPKAIEAAQSFANGVRGGPSGAFPVKNTVPNKIAHEAGGLTRDVVTDKPKKQFEANAKQAINTTANVVQSKLTQTTKPASTTAKPTVSKQGTPLMKAGNINNSLNKPMKPLSVPVKPKVAVVNRPSSPKKPSTSGMGKSSPDTSRE